MTEFCMPKLGITMDEGTVSRWLVREGGAVRAGDPLLLVETDKAEVEVVATEDAVVLKILVDDGGSAPVGKPIAYFGKPGEQPAVAPAATHPATATAVAAERRRASPLARRLAAAHGLELGALSGTGPRGRVIRRDVEAALAARAATPAAVAAPAASPAAAPVPAAAAAGPTGGRLEQLSRMRRIIAERMTYSVQTIPTFRITMAADVTATLALRDTLAPLLSRAGVRLTLTDFLIQAAAQALMEHPAANASFVAGPDWASSQIRYHDRANIGLAVAVPDGLLVPVLAGADTLSLVETARQRSTLAEGARAGRLRPDQLSGGTFTISNLGPYGVEQFDAIINPPEAAILAAGRAVPKPVFRDGRLEERTVIYLTATCDHRVLDGAAGARFLGGVVERLEQADRYGLL